MLTLAGGLYTNHFYVETLIDNLGYSDALRHISKKKLVDNITIYLNLLNPHQIYYIMSHSKCVKKRYLPSKT